MLSRKEEERNEKIIRGLMKLPPNRRCINCNSLGPQYICTNFWTFVCVTCSGIHREFTHRVKSVSMAKFTSQEVEALQKGGNQRARETLLKDWDLQRQRLPDSSNVDRVREFIKNVYVDRKYAGGKTPDKPPRDMQCVKNHQDDTRRASSYHSYSQSPPYEYQYEERKYGRQAGVLSRKPGSDRGSYERKVSSFVHSPGRLGEQMYEDRFANEGSGSRVSDYSVSSPGDSFKSGAQSPNFQGKHSSPPIHPVRDILVEVARRQGGIAHTQRNASLGSFGSFDSASMNSFTSGSLLDGVSEPEQSAGTQRNGIAPVPSLPKSSISANAVGSDPFGLQFEQPPSAPSVDLFAGFTHQNLAATPSEQKSSTVSFPENQGWATFDLPQQEASISQLKNIPPAATSLGGVDSMANASVQWSSLSSTTHRPFLSVGDQWHGGSPGVQASSCPPSEPWNAFGDTLGTLPQASHANLPYLHNPQASHANLPYLYNPQASHANLPYLHNPQAIDYNHSSTVGPRCPPIIDQHTNSKGGTSLSHAVDRISTNPFDIPYDSEVEAGGTFLNMNSLQATLPDSQLSPAYVGELTQSWFPQNTVTPFMPTTPQGGLAMYMAGEAPPSQLPSIPSQGSVTSLGGNPFA